MRILLEVNNADLRIGAANDALDLAELTRPFGAQFLICGPLTDAFCAEAARRGATTCRAASRTFSRLGLVLYAIDVLRWMLRLAWWRPQIVHINYAGYGPSLACAAWIVGIPVVARAGPFFAGNLTNRWVSAYVANCRPHAEALLNSPLADRVVVAGDLFRPERLASTSTLERPLPSRRPGITRAVFLGQLVERKGLQTLVEALARVDAPVELLLCGGDWNAPGYPQRLKAIAHDRGLHTRIHFENHRQDVGAILQDTDILVLPSLSEARPRCIIEAMSSGVPVVASDVGGIPSLVASEETGLLVPPGNPDRLAAAIERLARSPEVRARFGAAARARVAIECRPDRTALEHMRLYGRLAGSQTALISEQV